jgi:hypothetical protein
MRQKQRCYKSARGYNGSPLQSRAADYHGWHSAASMPTDANADAITGVTAETNDAANVPNEFVIRGVTHAGKPFRPSDWAERLCGVMAQFGADRRMQYSPYARQILSDEVNCVVVDAKLETIEPMAYRFLMNFARDNELEVRPGRRLDRVEGTDLASTTTGAIKPASSA